MTPVGPEEGLFEEGLLDAVPVLIWLLAEGVVSGVGVAVGSALVGKVLPEEVS